MTLPAFWIGIAMIAYDATGHAACLAARLSGKTGAQIWNSYSLYIWPGFSDSNMVWYDAYWTAWFTIAIALIIVGHFAGRTQVFTLTLP